MTQEIELRAHCPDCGVGIGELHEPHCDIERCPACGCQLLSCDCFDDELEGLPRMPWTGEFPGCAECREYGLYARRVPGLRGWTPCDKDDEGATEDLNRLIIEGTWDSKRQRWVLPRPDGGSNDA